LYIGQKQHYELVHLLAQLVTFKNFTRPFPFSFTKYLERKVLLATNVMANVVTPSVQDTSSSTKDLTCSTTYVE
jgi:hypothetical protein